MNYILLEKYIKEVKYDLSHGADGVRVKLTKRLFEGKPIEEINAILNKYDLKIIYNPSWIYFGDDWVITKIDCKLYD